MSEVSLSLLLPKGVELPLNLSLNDAVGELISLISESEGITLGSIALLPCVKDGDSSWRTLSSADMDQVEVGIEATLYGNLSDFSSIACFTSVKSTLRKGLKVVEIPYSPIALSNHLIRLRDSIYSSSPLAGDSAEIGIASGVSLFSSIRGTQDSTELLSAAREATEGEIPEHAFANWTIDSLTPYAALSEFKFPQSSSASSCIRSLAVSPWSPPPHPLRVRGHIIYLVVSTLEGETYHITGASTGFWISNSGNSKFDPSPKLPTPRGVESTPYHSLFDLLSALSPSFTKGFAAVISQQNPADVSDIYTSLRLSHGRAASSWLVPTPVHTSDPLRSQLAYLVTGATTADLLPAARDWNDELTQFRELPAVTLPEIMLRSRLLSRTSVEFASAATRSVLSIVRGDIAALNPEEDDSARTYVHNNMLFTLAEDPVGSFAHVGGSEAARVAASKDLHAVGLLEKLDITGLHTMATVVIDHVGQRWIVQSLIPGLFNAPDPSALSPTDEEVEAAAAKNGDISEDDAAPVKSAFKIVYGSVNPEQPDELVKASKHFGALAAQIAAGLKLAEHTVRDSQGRLVSLWTSSDIHGVASDGRSYIIDCFRMHCVDIEFLEKDCDGSLFVDANCPARDSVVAAPTYPHRFTFLRAELIQNYFESKLQKWIEDQVYAARDRAAAEKAESTDVAIRDSPDAPMPQSIVNAADFKLSFNSDAFVERKPDEDGTSVIIYDVDAPETKAVRDAAVWLREIALPGFIVECVSGRNGTLDGVVLSTMLHRQGINMRYLGHLASLIDTAAPTLDFGKTLKPDVAFELAALKQTFQHEMVARAAKHILNRLIRESVVHDHPAVISHFFNCLLGSGLDSNPSPVTDSNVDHAWTSLTPVSLRTLVKSEAESRFRYTLPAVALGAQLRRVKMLRELCVRVGIQLHLRDYQFGSVDFDAPVTSAAVDSDDQPTEKSKKKKSLKKLREEGLRSQSRTVSFRPEDVLNIMPVVKQNEFKSNATNDLFESGCQAFADGQIELGQESTSNALAMSEQIHGSIHPDTAVKSHALGIIYHQLHQSATRSLEAHERATEMVAKLKPEEREAATTQLAEAFLNDVDNTRTKAETYRLAALRMIRQSAIISERTTGLMSSEVAQSYADLAVLEQPSDAFAALRFARHAINIHAANGFDNPNMLKLLQNACVIVQTISPANPASSLPLLEQTRLLAEKIYGADSIHFAAASYTLGQTKAISGELANALPFVVDAAALFDTILGAESSTTIDANRFVVVLTSAIQREKDSKVQEQENRERTEAMRRATPVGRPVRQRVSTQPSTVVDSAAAPAVAERVVAVSDKSALSLDELVSFIQGTKATTSAPKTKKRRVPIVIA